MIRYAWQIKNDTTAVEWTSSVLSFSLSNRRKSYLETYNAGSLTLTIKNQNNEAAGFTINDRIGLHRPDGILLLFFWVLEVSYTDFPGNVGMSTATIVCQDGFGRIGRVLMDNYSISAGTTAVQFEALQSAPGYKAYNPELAAPVGAGSTASASPTTTGSILNYVNLLVNTERGMIGCVSNRLAFVSRNYLGSITAGATTIGRLPGASQIGYSSFERINLGLDFMNQVQVQPAGLATQSATNAESVATYGASGFSVSTVDATEVQALGLANWLVNLLSDQTKQRFIVEFTDVMQSMTVATFDEIAANSFGAMPYTLTYRVPGAGSDTSVNVVLEGCDISATPSQTTVRWYLTPLTYYDFFTLDSATLGILDTSRLGW